MVPTTAVRQPAQARSRRTLDHILDATERLLDQRRFEDISVADIVRTARASVGSFYARFEAKEDLLPTLYARYDERVGARLGALEATPAWIGDSLEDAANVVVAHFIEFFRERTELLRALALYVRRDPQAVDTAAGARRKRQHDIFVHGLLAHRAHIRHPDPERAVESALYFVVCACRDKILFAQSTHAAAVDLDDEAMQRELVRMLCGYLGHAITEPHDRSP